MDQEIIQVNSVEEEREIIQNTACSCGGKLRKTFQTLEMIDDLMVDHVFASCYACNEEHEFLFDTSSFMHD